MFIFFLLIHETGWWRYKSWWLGNTWAKKSLSRAFVFLEVVAKGGWWQLLKCHLWGLVLDLQVRLYRVGFSTPSHLSDQSEDSFLKCWALIGQLESEKTGRRQPLKVPGCGSVYSKKTSQRSIECGDDVIVHLVWLEHLMVMSLYTFSTITAIYE